MSVKQKAISMDDSAMAVEEKKNPMAHQLLMKIPKKDRPGIKLAEVEWLPIQSNGKMRFIL
jgi:hypothetical protein